MVSRLDDAPSPAAFGSAAAAAAAVSFSSTGGRGGDADDKALSASRMIGYARQTFTQKEMLCPD